MADVAKVARDRARARFTGLQVQILERGLERSLEHGLGRGLEHGLERRARPKRCFDSADRLYLLRLRTRR